jgi:hypothetical protein
MTFGGAVTEQKNEEASALLVLTSGTVPGTDQDAFNRWYTGTHVPDILTIPGIISCRRYRVTTARLHPGHILEPAYEYSAIYQIRASSDEALQAVAKRIEDLGNSGISESDAFDYSRVTAAFLLPVSDVITKDAEYRRSDRKAEQHVRKMKADSR